MAAACGPAAGRTATASSVDAFGAGTWVLRSWNADETAPVQPEVTLQVQDGRVAGTSGCNRYTASIAAGTASGDVVIGAAAGTRMMCPEEQMQVEERFLLQLGAVRTAAVAGGQLALTYEIDGRAGVMTFARQ
jgi:putative lipoprotein